MESKKYPIGGYAPGNYSCTCCKCGTEFSGDKRAVECEQCAVSAKEKFDALSPEQQQATLGRNVIIANWMFETPLTPERDLILRIVSQWGNTVDMPNMEQWLKDYAAKAQPGPRWVNVSKRLPENDMHMDYPREYCLMCKCDGSRGAVEYKQGNFSEIQDLWHNGPYDVIWWLDERSNANHSTPAGREEDAVAFAEWLNSNFVSIENKDGEAVYVEYSPQEYDKKQQFKIGALYELFKQHNP